MPVDATAAVRIARPSLDLGAAERFWTAGLGLEVLYRSELAPDAAPGEHELLMVGWPTACWHLELTHDPHEVTAPTPTADDLLVLYLDASVPAELVNRLEQNGGTRVPAHNPYWDTWGVTVRDPDGYLLVLCSRGWPGT